MVQGTCLRRSWGSGARRRNPARSSLAVTPVTAPLVSPVIAASSLPGHRTALEQQVEAPVISWAQPQALGDSMVEQHRRGALPPPKVPEDVLAEPILSPGRTLYSHEFTS